MSGFSSLEVDHAIVKRSVTLFSILYLLFLLDQVLSNLLEIENVSRRFMLHCARLFQVLPQLLQVYRVLSAQFLHLSYGLTLIDNEFLVPCRCKGFKLISILLLDLDFLSRMLVIQRDLQSLLRLLSNLHDAL